ncbi:MAG: STAS-like domain-containing protein [Azoarcus sp.]|jgi:hypothetical protein|nr:STAS-like domain-containing protein [Azoarcus sp.]
MANRITLKIYDLVGPIWVSTDDGQKVFDKIVAAFKADYAVDLSFANHENLISSFLNAAIRQLYNGSYSEDFLSRHLAYVDLDDDDRIMLDRTIDNAKRYFANRDAYDQAWKDVVDEEVDEEFDEEFDEE